MIFGFLVNLESTITIYSYSTPWGFLTNDALHLNSLFWFPPSPTAVHRFDASDMAVPGLYISWSQVQFWFFFTNNQYTIVQPPKMSSLYITEFGVFWVHNSRKALPWVGLSLIAACFVTAQNYLLFRKNKKNCSSFQCSKIINCRAFKNLETF